MSTNYLYPGKTMTYTAPSGGVTSGLGYLIGALFVVACADADATEEFQGTTEGVWTLPKTISEGDLPEGKALFWDVANGKVTVDPTLGLPIGSLAAAALTAATTCSVRLNGVSLAGRMFAIRKRFSIAQINAGATLVPALPGAKIRMVDAAMISIGGAVGAADSVDILGTQSASSVKLLATAIAALTQNTLVRAGATNAAILTGGVSFAQNDVNTAITVAKTGATATTATHVDVLLTYSIE